MAPFNDQPTTGVSGTDDGKPIKAPSDPKKATNKEELLITVGNGAAKKNSLQANFNRFRK